jgi:hypothetical protein
MEDYMSEDYEWYDYAIIRLIHLAAMFNNPEKLRLRDVLKMSDTINMGKELRVIWEDKD